MMKLHVQAVCLFALVLAAGGISQPICGQDAAPLLLDEPQPPSALEQLEAELGYSELTRGPVHEAFAEQVNLNPEPGIIVPKEPPPPIEEIPPENKPEGEGVFWADGYWGWDDDDFVWVSGGWRIAPRGYQWVAGYWAKVEKGFQWIGGFWATADRDEVAYLPAPPKSLDEGPTSAAPANDYFWNPGCWYYQDSRYVWRPGFWAPAQANYVWVPHYYRWTPRGCILAGGYWDYPLALRGYLFAPLAFHRPVYLNDGFRCTPRITVDLSPLHFHLFVRPDYCHYYFGDYYGDRYAQSGWFPWHAFYGRRHCYDPLFTFNVVRYRRHGVDFHDRLRRWNKYFHDHEDFRPPHTFKKQKDFIARHRDHGHGEVLKTVSLGGSFSDAVRSNREKFVRLDDAQRTQLHDLRERFGQIRQQRTQLEIAEKATKKGADRIESAVGGTRFPSFKLPGRDHSQRDVSELRERLGRSAQAAQGSNPTTNRVGAFRPDSDVVQDTNVTDSHKNAAENRGRENAAARRDVTPRNQPRPDFPSDLRQRLEQRLQQAQQQQRSQRSKGPISPRDDHSAKRVDQQPQFRTSPGAERIQELQQRNAQRVQTSPGSEGTTPPARNPTSSSLRQSPGHEGSAFKRPLSQPQSTQRSDSPARPTIITPQRSFPPRSESQSNQPSTRLEGSGEMRQPTRTFRLPTPSSQPSFRSDRGGSKQAAPSLRQSTPSSQPSIRSNSNSGSNSFSRSNRGSERRVGSGNSNSGRSRSGKKRD